MNEQSEMQMADETPEKRERTARPRVRRSDATSNHEALLRAAQSVIASNPNASLDSIAQAAGLSRRALYGHFADRESLLREVIAIGAERFNEIAEATDDSDPRLALARLAARLWREASAVRAAASIALDETHVSATVRSLGPLRRRVRELTDAGVRSGAFRLDLPAGTLAALIEETARATLLRPDIDGSGTPATVVRMVLSIAGLSWQEQARIIDEHPDIVASE